MNNTKSKKIALVFGGNGLIGSTIASLLKRKNYDVIVIDSKQRVSQKKYSLVKTDALKNDAVAHLLIEQQPNLVVNCINIATIYSHNPRKGYPNIIQFYSNLYRGLSTIKHPVHYIQVGTTGSGGLGFNIPFTHGEKSEDLPIIHKAAFAGITTSMLTLLSRSFDGLHSISEIKPGLAVFRDDIVRSKFNKSRLILLDGGESGHYTYDELRMLVNFMGFTTAERVTDKVVEIIEKKKIRKVISHFDIIENLNRTIIVPTANDLAKRDLLLESMQKLSGKQYIIATGSLGPPALTRDLILSYLHLSDRPETKGALGTSLSQNQAVSDTLTYIAKHNKKLFGYLKGELNYQNYHALQKHTRNCDEPWQIATKKYYA